MRIDQRKSDQLRPVRLDPGFTATALGSVLIASGKTRVLCTASVEPKTPPWLEHGGWITAEYAMLPGATSPRGRRDPGGRGKEIQRLIGRSLRAAVDLAKLVGPDGGLSIICDCDVIEADGGTRTASITGAWVALELALRKLVASGRLATHPGLGPVAAVCYVAWKALVAMASGGARVISEVVTALLTAVAILGIILGAKTIIIPELRQMMGVVLLPLGGG